MIIVMLNLSWFSFEATVWFYFTKYDIGAKLDTFEKVILDCIDIRYMLNHPLTLLIVTIFLIG